MGLGVGAGPWLLVTSPSGQHTRVRIEPIPFHIGRLADNHLVLRDNRISRRHARIVLENGLYVVEDLGSRHGVFVNGLRIQRHPLQPGDRISFGFSDCYELAFAPAGPGLLALAAQAEPGGHLAGLRATLELARALQASLSTDEVLAAVIEAALAVTGCRRGYLLQRTDQGLQVRVAREANRPLPVKEGKLPLEQLEKVLLERRQLLTIEREAVGGAVAIPLVRIRTGQTGQTTGISAAEDTAGLLYMEAAEGQELPAGSGELLTTLALEASTVLENARLLEEQWARQRMEEELKIARRIQESLLPRRLPASRWLRLAGSSLPSREVGGDFYDARPVTPERWALIMADVSGKGVGAALLAALLQGMFLPAAYLPLPMEEMMARVNGFLLERTGGEQYATVYYGLLDADGRLRMVSAGHPPALWLRRDGVRRLPAASLPLGLLEEARYKAEEIRLEPGDRLVLYTDGVTDARNASGEFFGLARLEQTLRRHAEADAAALHQALLEALSAFAEGAEQSDDITLLTLAYQPA